MFEMLNACTVTFRGEPRAIAAGMRAAVPGGWWWWYYATTEGAFMS